MDGIPIIELQWVMYIQSERESPYIKQAEQHPKYVNGKYNVKQEKKGGPRGFMLAAMACQSASVWFPSTPVAVLANLTFGA